MKTEDLINEGLSPCDRCKCIVPVNQGTYEGKQWICFNCYNGENIRLVNEPGGNA